MSCQKSLEIALRLKFRPLILLYLQNMRSAVRKFLSKRIKLRNLCSKINHHSRDRRATTTIDKRFLNTNSAVQTFLSKHIKLSPKYGLERFLKMFLERKWNVRSFVLWLNYDQHLMIFMKYGKEHSYFTLQNFKFVIWWQRHF